MSQILDDIRDGIIEGQVDHVVSRVQQALDEELMPGDILNDGLIAAMAEVGRRYEAKEFFVPEMLIAASAMKKGMNVLKPHLVSSNVKPRGTVIAGTVKGDLHDIGKNLVCVMLEGSGFEIYDLGVDVSAEQFLEALRSREANIVAMSALLTTTMVQMRTTMEALSESGVRNQVKVLIGGAPVNERFAREIGADGYAPDAYQSVQVANSLVE
ncbi:MAG TPA: corrinoid protein [bacterium]|nr:corrinoid protein [bacterium]